MTAFEHYSRILDELIENNEFFQFYFQSPYSLDDDDDLRDNYVAPRGVSLCCGATRGTLISDEYDAVVKFNLAEATDDVCGYECRVYEAAVNARLDMCFAHVYYAGEYVKTVNTWPAHIIDLGDGDWNYSEALFRETVRDELGLSEEDKCPVTIKMRLYAYEKASNVGWACSEYEDEDSEIASSYESPLLERAEEVAASFVHEYGETIYADLSSFLNEWNVNDLHCGNIGWIDGRFVLIDYAGYHEEY